MLGMTLHFVCSALLRWNTLADSKEIALAMIEIMADAKDNLGSRHPSGLTTHKGPIDLLPGQILDIGPSVQSQ